ncbi:unnamed protein product [Symbiodinium sp. CCMP2592]|nr:unnamed protein product [Symbiodinium sp. CCMP2592]
MPPKRWSKVIFAAAAAASLTASWRSSTTLTMAGGMPPVQERIFMVTGATDGIGKFTAEQLAKLGSTVIIHGRNPRKIEATIAELQRLAPKATLHGVQADLSLMSEVRRLGEEVADKFPTIHGLLNNAGTFDGDYTGRRVETAEGNEYSLAVNVMAPFLLTSLLLKTVKSSGAGRIIVTSSVSKGSGDALNDLQLQSGWSGHRAYSLSKLCDAMMIVEMDRRYGDAPRLCFHTMDPGTVDTKMLRAGWWSGGSSVRTATKSFRMLTEDSYQASSGQSLGGGEISDNGKRAKLWQDVQGRGFLSSKLETLKALNSMCFSLTCSDNGNLADLAIKQCLQDLVALTGAEWICRGVKSSLAGCLPGITAKALNKLFQQIYERADEDTRNRLAPASDAWEIPRAAQAQWHVREVAVLTLSDLAVSCSRSTNWGEVASNDYEGKDRPTPPDGQEWRDWSGVWLESPPRDEPRGHCWIKPAMAIGLGSFAGVCKRNVQVRAEQSSQMSRSHSQVSAAEALQVFLEASGGVHPRDKPDRWLTGKVCRTGLKISMMYIAKEEILRCRFCGGPEKGKEVRIKLPPDAVAKVRPEEVSGGEVLQLYVEASGGVDPREQPEGTWVNALCPCCNGGRTREISFSMLYKHASHRRLGGMICKCWRQNKCGETWFIPDEKLFQNGMARRTKPTVASKKPTESVPHLDLAGNMELQPSDREYLLHDRKIPEEVVDRNGIYSKPLRGKGTALVFPYRVGDKIVAEKCRKRPKSFFQSKGGCACLYGVDDLLGEPVIVITEGEIDKLSVEAAGYRGCASLQNGCAGGISRNYGAGEALDSAEKIILALDGDNAGQAALQKLANELGRHRCYSVNWPDGCKDANDVLCKHGANKLRILLDEAERLPPPCLKHSFQDEEILQYINDVVTGAVDPTHRSGISTGWSGLDGFYRVVPGEVTVITGIPGSGKTEWLLSMAANIAHREDWRILLFTFEANTDTLAVQMSQKLKYMIPELSQQQETQPGCMQEDMTAYMNWMDDHFEFGVDSFENLSVDQIVQKIDEVIADGGLQGVIIDPYNFIERPSGKNDNEHHFVGALMQRLRKVANDKMIHVWIVAHPTKSAQWNNVRPNMYNIAGSSNWFNKTDMGIIVDRRSFETDDGESVRSDQVEIIVEKVRNREAGKLGKALLLFDRESRSYQDATHLLPPFGSQARKALTGRSMFPAEPVSVQSFSFLLFWEVWSSATSAAEVTVRSGVHIPGRMRMSLTKLDQGHPRYLSAQPEEQPGMLFAAHPTFHAFVE